jgi:nucleotide-sensitive chloride channel 1A
MVFIREFPTPSEGIRLQKDDVEAQVGTRGLGKGTLFIAENAISWIGSGSSVEGFRILYPDMVLHAVSRDRDLCASDCIYIMVNGALEAEQDEPNPNSEADEEEEMTEIRFIPEDPSHLQQFYDTISECNLLHDPPQSSSSDDMDPEIPAVPVDDEHMEDGDGDSDDERLAMFQRMNLHFGVSSNGNGSGSNGEPYDPQQFEDAD